MRRTFLAIVAALAITAGRAEAVTIRDLIELSKAGLSDPVLLALIDAERVVFTLDTPTLKQLKEGGVSDEVIMAVIRSGRPAKTDPPSQPVPMPAPDPLPPPPPPAPFAYPSPIAYPVPVAIPVYVPVPTTAFRRFDARDTHRTVTTTFATDQGLVKATAPVPPNCVKAEPVYWGFGGQLRPGSYPPPPMVVCR